MGDRDADALSLRKDRVLSAVIDDYIRTAEPVASGMLARRHDFGLSPATIRNDLAALEDRGLLDKPHTSAGRVPSDRGYRYYVDRLVKKHPLTAPDLARIRQALSTRVREIEWFLHQTAKLVSEATSYPALVVTPRSEWARVARLSFTPIGADAGVLVVQTDSGRVENRVLAMPQGVDAHTIQALADEVSRDLGGVALSEVADRLARSFDRHARILEEIWEWLSVRAAEDREPVLYGAMKLARQPEFQDVEHLRSVVELLEQVAVVERLFGEAAEEPMTVRIGREVPVPELSDLSVVVATCQAAGQVLGQVAVIGPRRMEYGRVMAVMEQVVAELSQVLNWL